LQSVTSADDHVSVFDFPKITVDDAGVMLTVGTRVLAITVAAVSAVPPAPRQVNV